MNNDGFKDQKNIYTCHKCGGHIVTVDVAKGVTPFMIPCEFGCKENMTSSVYRVFDQKVRADYEWYAPTAAEQLDLPQSYLDHVRQGGLMLRKTNGQPTNFNFARTRGGATK